MATFEYDKNLVVRDNNYYLIRRSPPESQVILRVELPNQQHISRMYFFCFIILGMGGLKVPREGQNNNLMDISPFAPPLF